MKKKLMLFMLLLICLSIFSGCYDYKEIDDHTYAIAIGFDIGKVMPLKMTLQYANPNALNPSSSTNTSGENVGNVSIEATTVAGGIKEMNDFVGKEIDISHSVLLVFSEEYAKLGIGEYMFGLTRNRDFRPTMYVAICRGSAEKYLKSIKPIQESDPSKYYKLLLSSFRDTGYTLDSNLFKFYCAMQSPEIQPTANLVGVNKYKSTKAFTNATSTFKEKGHIYPFEGDFKAGDIPRVGDQKGELMGVAVFDGDKLVGELDGEGAMNFLIITGTFGRAYLTIPDPKVPNKFVIIEIKQSRKPVNKVDISSSNPKITSKIQLEGDITIIQSGYNYEDIKSLPIIEEAVEAFIKRDIEYLVNKTIVEYKSDIFGFGKVVKKKFLTIDKWIAYNWLNKYKDSTFKVDVDMKIRRPGLKLRTSPIIYSQKKESSK